MPHSMTRGALPLTLTMTFACAGSEPHHEIEAPPAIAGLERPHRQPATPPMAPVTAGASAASARPPEATPREPVSLQVGERVVQIAFKAGPLGFVSEIMDGDIALTPPAMKSKEAVGRGGDLLLIDHAEQDGRAYALFAATTHGSPECGSYGFWALRLDAKGVRVTPLVEGCFLSVGDGHPKIVWSSPALLVVESPEYQPGTRVEVFTLDAASFAFRSRLRAKAADSDAAK